MTATTTGRTRTPPTPLEFHRATPRHLREAANAVNEVLWVFEWIEEEGVSLAEFWIDTEAPQPRLGLTRYVRNTDDPFDPHLYDRDIRNTYQRAAVEAERAKWDL